MQLQLKIDTSTNQANKLIKTTTSSNRDPWKGRCKMADTIQPSIILLKQIDSSYGNGRVWIAIHSQHCPNATTANPFRTHFCMYSTRTEVVVSITARKSPVLAIADRIRGSKRCKGTDPTEATANTAVDFQCFEMMDCCAFSALSVFLTMRRCLGWCIAAE